MNKLSAIWHWLVDSSKDPQKLSLTVASFSSLAIVQMLFNQILPGLGVHFNFDLATFGDTLSSVVYWGATAITALATLIGFARKLVNTIVGR